MIWGICTDICQHPTETCWRLKHCLQDLEWTGKNTRNVHLRNPSSYLATEGDVTGCPINYVHVYFSRVPSSGLQSGFNNSSQCPILFPQCQFWARICPHFQLWKRWWEQHLVHELGWSHGPADPQHQGLHRRGKTAQQVWGGQNAPGKSKGSPGRYS